MECMEGHSGALKVMDDMEGQKDKGEMNRNRIESFI